MTSHRLNGGTKTGRSYNRGADSARWKGGTGLNEKGYPRIWTGPLRGQYLHRVVAAAMLGRELTKDEEVDHRDGDKRNFHWTNLIIRGSVDHGWKSAKQAWVMREKDGRLKELWEQFIQEQDNKQQEEVLRGKQIQEQGTGVPGPEEYRDSDISFP